MDDNLASTAPQDPTLEIYKDAFVPQPRPRTRAWERAPVDARTPRLQGRKIWKKAGYKVPQDDKENFEATLMELEKGGVGARKKQRIMGAKENINDAQWHLATEGAIANALESQSPKKNGRPSLAAGAADALLVPRKRTNANHLITPRKPLRKISKGTNSSTTYNLSAEPLDFSFGNTAGEELLKRDHLHSEFQDELSDLLSSDHKVNEAVDSVESNSDKPERRRKSLRRSTRRLTQNDISKDMPAVPTSESQSNSLSVVVWSAPAFEVFRDAQRISEIHAPSVEPPLNRPNEVTSEEQRCQSEVEDINYSREPSTSIVHTPVEESDEFQEDNASANATSGEQNDLQQSQPIVEESSRGGLLDHETDGLPNLVEETTEPTTSLVLEPELPTTKSSKTATVNSSPRKSTPRSKKPTPQRGSRRSTRTSRINLAESLAHSAGLAAENEARLNQEDSASVEVDRPTPQPENNIMQNSHSIPSETTVFEGTLDSAPSSGNAELMSESSNAMVEEIESSDGKDLGSPPTTQADEISVSMDEIPTDCIDQQPKPPSQDVEQVAISHEMDVDSELTSNSSPDDANSTFTNTTQTSTVYESIKQLVNPFPSVEERESEVHAPESLLERASGEDIDLNIPEASSSLGPEAIDAIESDESNQDAELNTTPSTASIAINKNTLGGESRPLIDHDDTDLLRDFVTRVKANKAAKAASGIPKRKRSLPHSPLRLPLGSEAISSPSASDAKDDDFDVSVPEPSRKRRKQTNHSLDEDELAEPQSTRRSGRTRLPVKTPVTAPSFIPVRRIGQDGDNTVTLRRSEEKELAALTKVNTRKNKGVAIHPAQVLAKKAEEKDDPASRQRALKEAFDEKAQKKEGKKGKTVVWAEELVQFQTDEDKKEVLEKEADKEQVTTVEEKKATVKVGMRSKMSLGMAVNGTPAPKRKTKGRS